MADQYWYVYIVGGDRNIDGGKWEEHRHLSRGLFIPDAEDSVGSTFAASTHVTIEKQLLLVGVM
jgi:hypothetical protein